FWLTLVDWLRHSRRTGRNDRLREVRIRALCESGGFAMAHSGRVDASDGLLYRPDVAPAGASFGLRNVRFRVSPVVWHAGRNHYGRRRISGHVVLGTAPATRPCSHHLQRGRCGDLYLAIWDGVLLVFGDHSVPRSCDSPPNPVSSSRRFYTPVLPVE